jgi:hypothetical protein
MMDLRAFIVSAVAALGVLSPAGAPPTSAARPIG